MHNCGAGRGEAVINVAGETEARISGASANVFGSGDSHLYAVCAWLSGRLCSFSRTSAGDGCLCRFHVD